MVAATTHNSRTMTILKLRKIVFLHHARQIQIPLLIFCICDCVVVIGSMLKHVQGSIIDLTGQISIGVWLLFNSSFDHIYRTSDHCNCLGCVMKQETVQWVRLFNFQMAAGLRGTWYVVRLTWYGLRGTQPKMYFDGFLHWSTSTWYCVFSNHLSCAFRSTLFMFKNVSPEAETGGSFILLYWIQLQ